MEKKLQSTLARIATPLNEANIVWGVGASILLHQYNLVESPADIDIITQVSDIQKADQILSTCSDKKTQREKSGIYSTDFFFEYTIQHTDVDLMAGFKINLQNDIFEYKFDADSVPHSFVIEEISIPFMTLEDWYILYQLIPAREHKVQLIENHFIRNGIEYPHVLKKTLENPSLPLSVIRRTKKLLNNANQ